MIKNLLFLLIFSASVAVHAGAYDDILAAANKDDNAQVIDLIRRGMDVNTADANGNSLLMIASRNGNLALIDFLLKNRVNLAKKNRYGDSALMLASLNGKAEVVARLVAGRAKVGGEGWNALHYAAYTGQTEILHILLEAAQSDPDFDLDAAAPNRQTALMLAASQGHAAAVSMLLAAGANPALTDGDGPNALDALALAKKNGKTQVIDILSPKRAK